MKDYREKTKQIYTEFPRNWIQILKAKVNEDLWNHILEHTAFLPDSTPNRDRALFFLDGCTEIKKCACGAPIYLHKNKTCGNGECTIKFRDVEKHQKAIRAASKLPTWGNKAAGSELVKKGYANIHKKLNAIEQIYDLATTIEKTKAIKDQIMGKAGNRSCIKIDPVLYKSIKEHTTCLKPLYGSKKKIPFSIEVVFITDYSGDVKRITCEECSSGVRFDPMSRNFEFPSGLQLCTKHSIKRGTDAWFQIHFNEDWETKKKDYYSEISRKGNLGLSGFIIRFGEDEGKTKYTEYWNKVFTKRKNQLYSEISQKLFWLIYYELSPEEQEKTKFGELNGEQVIFPGELHKKKNCMFIDFVCGKKAIEYNGSYWHQNEEEDKNKIRVLEANGFAVLKITDEQFNRKNLDQDIVNQCLNFIRGNTC